jgi:PAP2 superfamily protein
MLYVREPGADHMTALAAVGQRYLPRGWSDFARQLAIWFGFLAVYQLARGLADRDPTRAFENGLWVVNAETRISNRLYELTFEQFVQTKTWLVPIVSWTYWNSEFTVLGLALLWVYLRRNGAFIRFRNTILLANLIGLVGYVMVPTAPPRMLGLGFVDQHRDGLVSLAANPYAAMPSLHAADALIVGITLAGLCKNPVAKVLWMIWPAWVWFTVMATGNHFWMDVLGGILVAIVAMAIIRWRDSAQARAQAARAA